MTVTPQEILVQVSRPNTYRDTIMTYSGHRVSMFYPRPEDVRSLDIARGLAGKTRYGAHSEPWITIAEHVMLVADIIDVLWPKSGKTKAGLAHDFCEGYTQDIQATYRDSITLTAPDGKQLTWKQLDALHNEAICKAFGMDPADIESPEVRAADILACSFEARDAKNIVYRPGLPAIPKEVAHLRMLFLSPEAAFALLTRRMDRMGFRAMGDPR